MNRKQKIIVSVTAIFLVLLLLVGITFAYFLTKIQGNENTKSISVTTANLRLVYRDGNGVINATNIEPGYTLDEKTFTVSNEGNAETDYAVVIEDVKVTNVSTGATTTFESNDFVYTLTCTSDGTDCDGIDIATTFPIEGGIVVGNTIEVGKTHTYSLIVTYQDTGIDQSNDMNKTLEAKVNIKDISTINPYNDNTNSLAYNIINNAVLGKTGTTLASVPETKPAVSISGATGTSVYANLPATAADGFYSWYGLSYGDTQEEADTSSNYVSGSTDVEKCNSVIGKYISGKAICDLWCESIGKVEACASDGTPIINKEVMDYENVLSVTQDDLGTSYYYRGQVEDNYVNFNNMCWRIVRIEGDGAIKLVLEDKDNTCTTADGNWNVGNAIYEDMKDLFDSWLTSSGIDISKLKKDTWCLGNTTDAFDRTTGELLSSKVANSIYDTYRRLYGVGTTPYATLRCDESNYESYESYIGTLTLDEAVFAGVKAGTSNYNNYLLNSYQTKTLLRWNTLTFSSFSGTLDYTFTLDENNNVFSVTSMYGGYEIRPAVTLLSSAVITGGNGTKNNPYVVE